MALRSLVASSVIVCFAVAASAQEAPQSVVTAINSGNAEFVRVWNKHDPAAVAALFDTNALFVNPAGNFVGRQAVQQYYEKLFGTLHPSDDFTHDVDHVQMLSNDLAIGTGHWTLSRPAQKGFWSAVYEHKGNTWEIRSHTASLTPSG